MCRTCFYVSRPITRIEGAIAAFCIGLIFRCAGAQVYYINRILAIWTSQTE